MCITFANPSEPCCSDVDRRCQACPDIDWQNYTWLWEQPQAAAQRRFLGTYPVIGLPADTVTYDARYAALRQKMTKGSACSWSLSGSREYFVHAYNNSGNQVSDLPLNSWTFEPGFLAFSITVLDDLDFPAILAAGNWFNDRWHSTDCYLKRVLINGRHEWRAGWSTGGSVGNAPEYVLRGSFDCEGTNEFWRVDSISAADLPEWLTLAHFPEWIRVTRVTA